MKIGIHVDEYLIFNVAFSNFVKMDYVMRYSTYSVHNWLWRVRHFGLLCCYGSAHLSSTLCPVVQRCLAREKVFAGSLSGCGGRKTVHFRVEFQNFVEMFS